MHFLSGNRDFPVHNDKEPVMKNSTYFCLDWLAALMDYYGEEKGKQIAARQGQQQLNFRKNFSS
jgi:hypothetical protein